MAYCETEASGATYIQLNYWILPMPRYRDVDDDSGVYAYEIGDNYIDVEFKGGATYRYSCRSIGAANLQTMMRLAQAGEGLNSFIQRRVKKGYEARLR